MKICKIKNCNKKVKGHGLCPMHLRRLRVHGDVNYDRSKINPICSVLGCNEKRKTKGMCSSHYHKQFHKENYIHAIRKEKIIIMCKENGCDNDSKCKGYCNKHYQIKIKSSELLYNKSSEDHVYSINGVPKKEEYNIWFGIIKRCLDINHTSYKYYGGKNITVCDRWKNSFSNFYEDMRDRPTPEHQIDREKNHLGYNKDNCRWVTPKVNVRNRDCVKLSMKKAEDIRLIYPGLTLKQLAKKYNVSTSTISLIINHKRWV